MAWLSSRACRMTCGIRNVAASRSGGCILVSDMHRLIDPPSPQFESFRDGLGVRLLRTDVSGNAVSVLRLNRDLSALQHAVRDRVDRLATLRLAGFAPVRGAGPASDDAFAFEITSDHVEGVRLLDVLELSGNGRLSIGVDAALHVIRQALGALAALHESRTVTHGAIGAGRLILTGRGQVVMTDYVLGLALSHLEYPQARLWMELGVAVTPGVSTVRFDEQTDITQVALVGLALLSGRPLDVEDYPDRLTSLIDSLRWRLGSDGDADFIDAAGDWLRGALNLGPRRRKQSARQAQIALEAIVTRYRQAASTVNPLRALLGDYQRARGPAASDSRAVPAAVVADEARPPSPPIVELPRPAHDAFGVVADTSADAPTATCPPPSPDVPSPSRESAERAQPSGILVRRRPAVLVTPEGEPESAPRDAIAAPPEPPRVTVRRRLAVPVRPMGAPGPAPEAPAPEPAEPPRVVVRHRPVVQIVPSAGSSDANAGERPSSPQDSAPNERAGCDGPIHGVAESASRRPEPLPVTGRVAADQTAVPFGRAAATGARAAGILLLASLAWVAAALRVVSSVLARGVAASEARTRRALVGLAAVIATASACAGRALAIAGATAARLVSASVRSAASSAGVAGRALGRGTAALVAASVRMGTVALAAGGRLATAVGRRGAAAVRVGARGLRTGAVTGSRALWRACRVSAVALRAAAVRLARGAAVAVRFIARAAVAAGGRSVVLAGRGRVLASDVAERARAIRVSRPVAVAALLIAFSWPGVRLARAWWPWIVEQRLPVSGTADDGVRDTAPTDVATAGTGTLDVRSEPAGADVWVDGVHRGRTPIVLQTVAHGARTLLLRGPAGSVRTTVRVRPGETTDLTVPIFSGWIAVFAPIDLDIREGGTPLGTSGSGRLLIAPGEHVLDLANERYGFADRRSVVVRPGEVTAVNVDLPPVPLEIVAPESAEVLLDGRSLGRSPLGTQMVPVGTSVLVMRHPDLGERRQTLTLTYRGSPNRAVF